MSRLRAAPFSHVTPPPPPARPRRPRCRPRCDSGRPPPRPTPRRRSATTRRRRRPARSARTCGTCARCGPRRPGPWDGPGTLLAGLAPGRPRRPRRDSESPDTAGRAESRVAVRIAESRKRRTWVRNSRSKVLFRVLRRLLAKNRLGTPSIQPPIPRVNRANGGVASCCAGCYEIWIDGIIRWTERRTASANSESLGACIWHTGGCCEGARRARDG